MTAYGKNATFLGSSTVNLTTTAADGGADTDGDGLPDVWETQHGLNPFAPDSGEDADRDGRTNLEEYLAGTDPWDAASVLQLSAALDASGVRLTFNAAAGRAYSVEGRGFGAGENWREIAALPAEIASHPAIVVLTPGTAEGGSFYRIRTAQ